MYMFFGYDRKRERKVSETIRTKLVLKCVRHMKHLSVTLNWKHVER